MREFVKLLLCLALAAPALAHAQSLTIQGKIFDGANRPVTGAATKFRVKVLSPDTQRCVLFDETHTVNLSSSQGLFSVNLGNGFGTQNAPATYSLTDALSNRTLFTVNASYCAGGGSGSLTYNPGVNDNRKVVIEFLDPATMGSAWEAIPEMDLNPVAWAMESRTVGGFPAASLLRVVGGGVPGSAPTLTSAEVSELQSLAAGTSTHYMQRGVAGGAQLPTYPGNPSSPSAGSIWFDSSAGGAIRYYDGSTVRTIGSGTGTLTSVVGGDGISASVTSGTATVSLSPSGVGTGGTKGSATLVPQITYDTYGRITGITEQTIGSTLPGAGADHQVLMSNSGSWGASYIGLADLRKDAGTPLFPGNCATNRTLNWNSVSGVFECVNLGGIASSQLAAPTGAAAGTYRSVSVNSAGQVLSGTNPTDLAGYAISDAVRNGGSVPQIRSGSADPSGAGVDGELYVATTSQKIFRYNLGNTTWETMASAGGAGGTMTGITAGTGIAVTGSTTTPTVGLSTAGVAAGTFAKVTTDTYGRVTSGSAQVADADIADVAFSKLTGKPTTLSGHGITEALVSNAGGAVSLQAGGTSGRPTPGTAGQIYIDTDTNTVYYRGASSWTAVGSGSTSSFTGSLAGEVTGTQGATQVSQIGSFLRATILGYFGDLQNATDAKSNGAIVKRDGTGGFAAGAVTADSVVLKGATSGTATLRAPATVTSYDVQLPAAAPTPGQVLSASSGTALTWTTPLSSSTINVAAPLTNPAGTIGINTASGSQAGALSSADWTTFNNKLGTALSAASIWVGNASGVATAVTPSGDVALSNSGAFTVGGIKGQTISAAGSALGQTLRYAGSNTWTPGFVSMADLRSTVTGTSAITGNCTAAQTLTWNSGSDNLQCQNISIAAATQISDIVPVAKGGTGVATTSQGFVFAGPISGAGVPAFRALDSADVAGLPNQWSAGSGNVFRNGGNVGIGTGVPSARLHVSGGGGARFDGSTSGYGTVGASLSTGGIALIGVSGAGTGFVDLDAVGLSATDSATVRFFRATNQTGSKSVQFFKGDNTATGHAQIGVDGANSYFQIGGGSLGIGTASPASLLHLATAASTEVRLQSTGGSGRTYGLESWTDGKLYFNDRTGGTSYMVADGVNGRLGIGLASPTATLHLKAGTATAGSAPLKFSSGTSLTTPENGAVEFDGTDLYLTSGGVRRKLAVTSGTNDFTGVNSITGGSGTLAIAAGGTNQNLTLAGSGTGQVQSSSVLSVTNTTASSSPSSGAMQVAGGLGVAGDIFAGASVNATTLMRTPQIYGSSAASGTLKLDGTSHGTKGDVLLNSGGGNVGIGTTSPAYKLEVTNGIGIGVTGIAPSITFTETDTPADWYNIVQDGGSFNIRYKNNWPAVPLTIVNTGNVGIGTTTPGNRLSVVDAAVVPFSVTATNSDKAVISLKADSTNWGISANGTTPATGSAGDFWIDEIGSGPRLYIKKTSGNVGIGTLAPLTQIHLGGSYSTFQMGSSATASDNFHWVNENGGGRALNLYNGNLGSGSKLLTILPSGNVGIGSATPGTKLDVAGTIRATGLDIPGAQQITESRSIPTTVNDAVDIGTFTLMHSGQQLAISISVANGSFSVSKNYFISRAYCGAGTCASGTWYEALPLGSSGPLSGNDFALDVQQVDTGSQTFNMRVRRTLGTTAGTAYVSIRNMGSASATYAASTTVNSVTAPTFYAPSTVITQVAGKLGIGTANPFSVLHVKNPNIPGGAPTSTGTTDPNVLARIEANVATMDMGMLANGNTWLQPRDRTNHALNFATLLNPNGGNVGIGTTGPSAKLHITGSANSWQDGIFLQQSGTGGRNYALASREGGIFSISDESASLHRLTIASNGYVGMGTTNPTYALDVITSTTNAGRFLSSGNETMLELVNTSTNGRDWRIASGGASGGFAGGKFGVYDNTAGLARLTIDQNGYVGIGTTTPNQRLSVADSLAITNSSGSQYLLMGNQDSVGANHPAIIKSQNGAIEFGSGSSWSGGGGTFTMKMVMSDSGSLGIGTTSPGQTLHSSNAGNYQLRLHNNSSAGSYMEIGSDSNGFARINTGLGMGFQVGSWEHMRLTSGGNLGVGTTNPNYRLDVQGGDINASGAVRSNTVALSSDIRWKKDIEPLRGSLERLGRIRGVSYYWRRDEFPEKNFGTDKQIGLIAQNVEAEYPEAVLTDRQGFKSVNYPALVAPVIEALRELAAQVSGVDERLKTLEAENARLKAQVARDDAAKARDLASVKEGLATVKGRSTAAEEKLRQENAELKARMDRIERALLAK